MVCRDTNGLPTETFGMNVCGVSRVVAQPFILGDAYQQIVNRYTHYPPTRFTVLAKCTSAKRRRRVCKHWFQHRHHSAVQWFEFHQDCLFFHFH